LSSNWYIVNVTSGFEKKVSDYIKDQSAKKGVADLFEEIVVPTENVNSVRRGKKVTMQKKIFPGYILVKMNLTDLTWNLVKATPKVIGFLGGGHKPRPISEAEAKRVMNQIEEGTVAKEAELTFEVGEVIKIIDGPFDTFTATIDEVEHDKKKLKVSVSIFGRSTPVELDYTQIEKINA
jgi:transcriptional antiterminator NusG